MFLIGDLGFPSLFLVVALVVPVIGLVIRSKWRRAVARQEEIKRLLAFAAEEAARVEYEASFSYGAVSVSKANHQCEVCYAPTTMRCSQCKAVRYCSYKCQYIHWGRGHKDECHPPAYTTLCSNDKKGDSSEEDRYGRHEVGGRSAVRPTKASPRELPSSDIANHGGTSLGKEDNIKVECHSDIEGGECVSETFSSPFSGFCTSPSSVESSDDASVCESVSSNEPERSERPRSVDTALHVRWTASGVNDVDQTDSLSPKFANLVNSVDKFSKLSKVPPDSSESKCSETIPLDLGIGEQGKGQSAEESKSSSSSWSKTLESVRSINGGVNKSGPTSFSRDGRSHSSSDSESTLQFSFNLSANTMPAPCTQGAKVNGIILKDPVPVTSSEDINLEVQSSPSLKREQSSFIDYVASNVSHVSKSADVGLPPKSSCIDLPAVSQVKSINESSTLKSEKSGTAISSDSGRTSHALNSRDTSRLSAYANPQSSSGVKVETVPSMNSEKVDVFHGKAATSPYVACPNNKNGFKTSMWKVVDQFRGSKLPKHSHIVSENEVAEKHKDKILFPYELFVKLYNWNKVELQPCGLINCGNSCYANVVLQCLAFTPPLTSYFLQGLHSNSCEKKEWCFTCEFENLILKAKEGKSVLNPIGILSQLQKIGSQLGNGKEEDAHEFLRYAIDTMQSVFLREAGVHLIGFSEEETTLIGQTFGGYLRSKIQCMKCQGKSERHERMMDLTVEIGGDIGTLEEALRRFSGTEILDGENKYHCSRCKSYEKAKKKLTILEAPNILTIALKRFQSGKFGKLNKSIRFPEILNLAPYMSGTNDRSPVYRLYGVVVHLDVMNAAFSGHYVCYVKNSQNKWFKIDDRTVSTSELERVLSKGAYMLLYARFSPRAPRMIRSKIISPGTKIKPKKPLSDSRSSTHSGSSHSQSSSIPPDSSSTIDSFYSNYQRLQRILEEDSLSDSSSLFSSNSDECSSSTDSTRYSGTADDLSELIFGEPGIGWTSPWRNSPDSDSPSSSYSRDSDHYNSGSSDPFFQADSGKHCRKLESSSYRETNSERLVRGSSFVSGVPFRRSTSERT